MICDFSYYLGYILVHFILSLCKLSIRSIWMTDLCLDVDGLLVIFIGVTWHVPDLPKPILTVS